MQRRTGGPFSRLLARRSPVPADHHRYPTEGNAIAHPDQAACRNAAVKLNGGTKGRRAGWTHACHAIGGPECSADPAARRIRELSIRQHVVTSLGRQSLRCLDVPDWCAQSMLVIGARSIVARA
ncbi:hypothetical protein CA13_09000 [Planctomycetes bacterium CA13]|uniref:Uncharacterized protein n=1 Tax=Novipirellula herctigrandis TaxID=2527986 RepID=A0A5C5YWS8_9BACT|nr:hypothetical protein CA13_09000 [Planctomycetes bacterium CA13]